MTERRRLIKNCSQADQLGAVLLVRVFALQPSCSALWTLPTTLPPEFVLPPLQNKERLLWHYGMGERAAMLGELG